VRIGRASSVAAAKAVSSRARFRTFWAIRVVGRSPVGWIEGNSSASMPLTCDWKRAGAHVERLVGTGLQVDALAAWQRSDEVREEPRRHRGGSVRLDLAGHPVHEPDLEVGRRQAETAILRLEEDVRQHGQRAPVGDRTTHDAKAARQVLLHDRELHVRSTPWARGASRRVPGTRERRVSRCAYLSFSRFVITIIMVWTPWTTTLRPVRLDRGPAPGSVRGPVSSGDASACWRWRTGTPARRAADACLGPSTARCGVVQPFVHVAERARTLQPHRISTEAERDRGQAAPLAGGAGKGRQALSRRRSARGRRRSRDEARRCHPTRG
jgi:hypothetical protein